MPQAPWYRRTIRLGADQVPVTQVIAFAAAAAAAFLWPVSGWLVAAAGLVAVVAYVASLT